MVDFTKEAVDHARQHSNLPVVLRKKADAFRRDFFDQIAELMFEVIYEASTVQAPTNTCWMVRYNAVWGDMFGLSKRTRAWKVVHFKLRRLLFDEIRELEDMPNYKSASILGLCLNVMGLKLRKKKAYGGYGSDWYALQIAVLHWTKKHYLHLVEALPDVASACLAGGITFDAENSRLVKTYAKGLDREAPKEYLDLERPKPVERVTPGA